MMEVVIPFKTILEDMRKDKSENAFVVIELDSMKVIVVKRKIFLGELLKKVFNPTEPMGMVTDGKTE
jgi:hypothetical protein